MPTPRKKPSTKEQTTKLISKYPMGTVYVLQFNTFEVVDHEGTHLLVEPVAEPTEAPDCVAFVESTGAFLTREDAIKLRDLLTEIIDVTKD